MWWLLFYVLHTRTDRQTAKADRDDADCLVVDVDSWRAVGWLVGG